MRDDDFEWDDAKAADNWRAHRVSFEEAALAVGDPFAIESLDTRQPYGEDRLLLIGLSQGGYSIYRAGKSHPHHLGSKGHKT